MSPVFTTRLKNSHKGDFGHALVIAGAPGYLGAARLAAEAAVRTAEAAQAERQNDEFFKKIFFQKLSRSQRTSIMKLTHLRWQNMYPH